METSPHHRQFLSLMEGSWHTLTKQGIKVTGVLYRVEAFMNADCESRSELCSGSGHIEDKCTRRPKCGFCSGHHWTGDHKCNLVGCTAKRASLCGHMLKQCPNCKRNQGVFSSWCAKKSDAAKPAWQSRNTQTAGRAPTCEAMHMATGTNRVVLDPRPRGGVATDG